MWLMVNSCKDVGLKYTGKYFTKHFGRTYLLNNSDELDILANAMENRIGLRYKTHMVNYHRHHEGFNAVCKSPFNPSF